MLNVTFEERERLGLRTIGVCDISREDRSRIAAAKKSERDRARKEQKRRKAGATPRDAYLAVSTAAEAKRLGVSRMTLYRRRKAEEKAREAACYRFGATIEERSLSNSAEPVTPPAQPAAVPERASRGVIWFAATFEPPAAQWRVPIVAANSDPAVARLGARVATHAAAHRRAAQVFELVRRAA